MSMIFEEISNSSANSLSLYNLDDDNLTNLPSFVQNKVEYFTEKKLSLIFSHVVLICQSNVSLNQYILPSLESHPYSILPTSSGINATPFILGVNPNGVSEKQVAKKASKAKLIARIEAKRARQLNNQDQSNDDPVETLSNLLSHISPEVLENDYERGEDGLVYDKRYQD